MTARLLALPMNAAGESTGPRDAAKRGGTVGHRYA